MSYADAQAMLNDLIRGFHSDQLQRQRKEIEADPKAHKDTNIMNKGGMRYRYYEVRNARQGYTHRFCYTKNKNVAGYYLSFTETVNKKYVQRTGFIGWDTKSAAIEHCRKRHDDAKKPREERRYVLPKIKRP